LKPERWFSPLAQEKYHVKTSVIRENDDDDDDDDDNNNNNNNNKSLR
jgi:hypothetical protein